MQDVELYLSIEQWSALRNHLLPQGAQYEEAAFVFAAVDEEPAGIMLRAVDWYAVPPGGFSVRSPYYLELTDETRAAVIKRAHDLQAALVEIHSHPFQQSAEFSPSDILGLAEFVPHVRWRLRRRPYAAVVIAGATFDAIAWVTASGEAQRLGAISVDGQPQLPTCRTSLDHEEGRDE